MFYRAASRPPPNSRLSPANSLTPPSPTRRFSFYLQNGKLIIESERLVPTELTPVLGHRIQPPDTKVIAHLHASMPCGSWRFRRAPTDPNVVFDRTGDPVHHVFHDYQRTEVMIPMRDGVKLHAVILKPADIATPLPFLMQRTPYGVDGHQPRLVLRGPSRTRARRLHLRRRRHSRPLQERRRIRHDAPAGRSHDPQSHRRKHRRLRHRRLAPQESSRQQRPRRSRRHQLSRIPRHAMAGIDPHPGRQSHLARRRP